MWCHLLLIMPVLGLALFAVLPLPIALPAYLVVSGISLGVYWAVFQAMHRPVTTGREGMLGAWAEAVTDLSPTGRIRYRGELWRAVAREPIPAGSRVVIVGVDGMRVQVRGVSNADGSGNGPSGCDGAHHLACVAWHRAAGGADETGRRRDAALHAEDEGHLR